MHVSRETPSETDARLLRVLAAADFDELQGTYAFAEGLTPPSAAELQASLACVRDGDHWSVLARSTDEANEISAVFLFHFPAEMDNSGFVGWLATHLKRRLGTGLFVICGSNSDRGGIFDYWGCPAHLRDQVRSCIAEMRRKGMEEHV